MNKGILKNVGYQPVYAHHWLP